WALAFGSAVTMILEIGVIFELASRLLLSRVTLRNGLRALMRWTIGGLVLVAAAASGSFAALAPDRELRGFEVVDFASSLIQVGLLFVLSAFSRALHISWRSWPTGVAVGFGVLSSIDLGTAAIRSAVGESAFVPVDVTQMTAFHVSNLIWLIYAFLPRREQVPAASGLRESDIQFWNEQLQRMAEQ